MRFQILTLPQPLKRALETGLFIRMHMPRFLSPFGRNDRHIRPEYSDPGAQSSYTGTYVRPQSPPTRTGSRWRNFLGRRDRQRESSYVSEPSYVTRPTYLDNGMVVDGYSESMGPIPMAMPSPHRSIIDDYSDSSYSNSEGRRRYPRRQAEPRYSHSPMYQEPLGQNHSSPYLGSGTAPRQPFLHEGEPIPPPSDHIPIPDDLPLPEPTFAEHRPEAFANMERMPSPLLEDASGYDSRYSERQSAPQRIRARRGQHIDVGGGVRLEVDGESIRGRHRRRSRSRSRSVDSYDSRSSGSYSYSSSGDPEPPVIISADPNMPIEIGNERDGFIPYQQYLANHQARRRTRKSRGRQSHSHSHRRGRHESSSEDEQVYIIPPGANVIFVDEHGRELHRVGNIDEQRYPPGRRNSRPQRDVESSSLPEYDGHRGYAVNSKYTERGIQTDPVETSGERQTGGDTYDPRKPAGQFDDQAKAQMHSRMRAFADSRPSSPDRQYTASGNSLNKLPSLPHTLNSASLGSPSLLFRPPSPTPVAVPRPMSLFSRIPTSR